MSGSWPSTVIVTRPEPDHAGLLDALADCGIEGIHAPAYRLVACSSRELARRLPTLSECDLVVVTSPFAARILVRNADGLATKRPFLVPGKGTASILREAGWAAAHPEHGGTSEDLLAMPELEAPAGQRIAIVAAPGGRTLLHRTLRDRGARVDSVYVYRREPRPLPENLLRRLGERTPPVVMVTSLKTAEALSRSIPDELRTRWHEARFIVSSARIADDLREEGARHVSVARGAADDAMIEALDQLRPPSEC